MVPVTLYMVVSFTKLYPDMPVLMCEMGIGNTIRLFLFFPSIFFFSPSSYQVSCGGGLHLRTIMNAV